LELSYLSEFSHSKNNLSIQRWQKIFLNPRDFRYPGTW